MPPALPTQVEREKLRSHEDTVRLNVEKGRLDRTLTGAELELAEAQRQIQLLEVSVLPTPPLCPSAARDPAPCPYSLHAQTVLRGRPRARPQREGSSPKWREMEMLKACQRVCVCAHAWGGVLTLVAIESHECMREDCCACSMDLVGGCGVSRD